MVQRTVLKSRLAASCFWVAMLINLVGLVVVVVVGGGGGDVVVVVVVFVVVVFVVVVVGAL